MNPPIDCLKNSLGVLNEEKVVIQAKATNTYSLATPGTVNLGYASVVTNGWSYLPKFVLGAGPLR